MSSDYDFNIMNHLVTPERKFAIVIAEHNPMLEPDGWYVETHIVVTEAEKDRIDSILGEFLDADFQARKQSTSR